MLHLSKDRHQSENPWCESCDDISKCHKIARGLLFGRISRSAVMSLGMGAIALLIALALMTTMNFRQPSSHVRDHGAAILIKHQ